MQALTSGYRQVRGVGRIPRQEIKERVDGTFIKKHFSRKARKNDQLPGSFWDQHNWGSNLSPETWCLGFFTPQYKEPILREDLSDCHEVLKAVKKNRMSVLTVLFFWGPISVLDHDMQGTSRIKHKNSQVYTQWNTFFEEISDHLT